MIILILLLLLTGGILLYAFQSRFLYFPHRGMAATPRDAGLTYEDIDFLTADGVRLNGWWIPAGPDANVLLHFHGNAGNISHRVETVAQFHRLGFSLFMIDYRGYGRSEGSPEEEGTYLDAAAAWEYLVNTRKIPADRIVLQGRSLGGPIAAHLAARVRPRALILESTFTSVPDIAARLYPFLPVKLLSRFDYNTADFLKDVHCPVLIIHSPGDEIVPFDHGTALYEAAQSPKEFLQIAGDHNEGFLTSAEAYEQGIMEYLSRH
jgi:hypothetical protein